MLVELIAIESVGLVRLYSILVLLFQGLLLCANHGKKKTNSERVLGIAGRIESNRYTRLLFEHARPLLRILVAPNDDEDCVNCAFIVEH